MKLNTEYHKGIAIQVVKKILGNTSMVEASWRKAGNIYKHVGNTKDDAVRKAKLAIDKKYKIKGL